MRPIGRATQGRNDTAASSIAIADKGKLTVIFHYCRSLIGLTIGMALSAATASAYDVVNTASVDLSYGGTPLSRSSNQVTVTVSPVPSPATAEFLRLTPDPLGTMLPATEYGDDDPAGIFAAVLPHPGPGHLNPAASYGNDETAIIRVTDPDRNVDTTTAESVLVRLGGSSGGDRELLRLYETGPNTGIFVGYIPLDAAPPASYDDRLSVTTNDIVRVDYSDPVNGDTASGTSLVDPYGFVFDSVSGALLDGVEVVLIDDSTGLEATSVTGDDGAPYPGRVTTGGTVTAGSLTYNFPPGGYRFPSIPPGDYRLQVVAPAGYSFPSAIAAPAGSYAVATPDSYGGAFTVNTAAPIRIDIPLDPVAGGNGLRLNLTTDRGIVAAGDTFTYTLHVENAGSATAGNVTVTQRLPVGFRYRAGSTAVNGVAAADPAVSADGDTLVFSPGDLPAGSTADIAFRVTVGAVGPGRFPSDALAGAASGDVSNPAAALVVVRDEFGGGKGFVAGRVIFGCDGRQGVEGARIFLEDGTYVLTDKRGRYHVEGVSPGTHVLQLDPVTLPDGYEPVLCEDHTRFAGTPSSRFVELRPGDLQRADFYLAARPVEGEVAIALDNRYANGSGAIYTVSLAGRGVPLDNLRLDVELPRAAEYLPGSALIDERAFSEPAISGRSLRWILPDVSGDWQKTITFRALIDATSETGDMPASARLRFDTPAAADMVTPDAESALFWVSRSERAEIQELFLRPHFATLDAELSESDRADLRRTVEQLKSLDVVRVYVVGHTDRRRIRWQDGAPYRDNFELSRARADAVAQALLEILDLVPEQVVTVGMGAADPLTDDASPEGMALNRRTDLRVLHRVALHPDRDRIDGNGGDVRTVSASVTAAAPPASEPDRALGITAPSDGQNLPHRIGSVRVRLDDRLRPRLLLDGREIPPERIGFRRNEGTHGTRVMTYVGIDFGEPGQHRLRIEGIGPFGNVRFEQEVTINRTGDIARLEIVDTDGNVADGRTPVRIRVALYDGDGQRIPDGAWLEVRDGRLIPLDHENARLPNAPESRLLQVDGSGVASFEPVSEAGKHHIRLGFGEIEAEADIFLRPEKRDWILVGLGEGTAGYSDVSAHVQPLDPNEPGDDYYDEGRIAFFAKGQIRGDWLLTLAYDSDKEERKDRSLHQVIDPDRYYTVYGDATVQGYEAASAEKLFVRIERDRFYAVFGDIETGLNVTELSRYRRSLTGVKSEWSGRRAGYSVFASETAQSFVRDEIRGDGTSGLYRLSRNDLVINSEKISIETRDRLHSQRIIERRSLQRHLDYDIDYENGTLFFKQPVPSRDRDMNPVFIIVDYETTAQGSQDYTFGGRLYGRTEDGVVEVGVSAVHEGRNAAENDLVGIDATVRLAEGTLLVGEWATSQSEMPGVSVDGDAWLAEIRHRSSRVEATAYVREQDAGFGLGQQNDSESGTRKLGGDVIYRFGHRLDVEAEAYRQENLTSGETRTVEAGSLNYRSDRFSLSSGLRHAADEPAAGPAETSDQLTLGADYRVTERLGLSVRQEVAIGDNENRDYPTRTLLGADYELNRSVTLFAEQEITDADAVETASTRLGLDARPWYGGQVRTSVEQSLNEAGRRVFGNLGLLQTWQVNPNVSVSFSVDRSQVLSGVNASSFHPDQPPASGGTEDFTALSTGLSWRDVRATFDSRIEYRTSDSEDKWGLFAGAIVEPEASLGLSLHGRYFATDRFDQGESRAADLSFGLAWRPEERSWIVLNRLEVAGADDETAGTTARHWKTVERLNAFWQVDRANRVAFRLGARHASDTFDGVEYSGLTTLFGADWRHDLSRRFDIGLHGSLLQVHETSQSLYHSGLSFGYSPARNAWISVGYNLSGFRDGDFSRAEYTARGPYLTFRFKFDQNSVRDALQWLARN